tara:strand:- start:694 stop:1170 length:477 start_codon:yes stop_codon:yes gene_type:complete
MKQYDYYLKFPPFWVQTLREELRKEFPLYPGDFDLRGEINYLPPVVSNSKVGKIAGRLPSKPEGITLWGAIYYTPNYPVVLTKYQQKYGEAEALVYEFGMFAHETYHAIEQELTGKLKWFTKYLLKLIKTPNAYKHPMEIPAYAFQRYLKKIARDSGS